jgi:hypothetical protein
MPGSSPQVSPAKCMAMWTVAVGNRPHTLAGCYWGRLKPSSCRIHVSCLTSFIILYLNIPSCIWQCSFRSWSFGSLFAVVLSVGIAAGYGLDDRVSIPGRGIRIFCSPQRPDRLPGLSSFLSSGYWVSFSGVKWPERDSDHSLSSNVEVKNGGASPRLPHTPSWRVLNYLRRTGTTLPLYITRNCLYLLEAILKCQRTVRRIWAKRRKEYKVWTCHKTLTTLNKV